MRKFIFLLLFLNSFIFSKSQLFDNGQANNFVPHIPAHLTYSTTDIAEYIKQNFSTDKKRLQAIYSWVAANIRYDVDSANNINLGADPYAKITAALRRKMGVCENYAAIFNDICTKAGLTSFIVDGYTKQNGFVDKTGHSWCAVHIDNKWWLCDPTWDQRTGKWYLVEPAQMIATHMPFDPMWQLLEQPISHQQFYNGNFTGNKNQPVFNYADSVGTYIKMDSLQRLRSAAYRIERNGLYNILVKSRHDFTKMHIELIREDRDVDLYNSAVDDLNNVTTIYNNFVQYRNKQFIPAVTDNALQALLDGIDSKLTAAHKKLDEIAKTEANFKFSTEDLRGRLKLLDNRVKEQKGFLKVYLNTEISNRPSLFYKQVSTLVK